MIVPKDATEPMGDVDLFMDGDGCAEVNILIVRGGDRRRGYAGEALILAMQYAIQRADIRRFIAKISLDNMGSRRFFEKIGFKLENPEAGPNVFGEITYILGAGDVPVANLNVESEFEINV